MESETLPALCYNLIETPGAKETNTEYAASLAGVLEKLGFPPEYIASVT